MRHCKASLVAIVLCLGVCAGGHLASAQTASGWDRVASLPAGSVVYVSANGSGTNCRIKSVAPDSLTCTGAGKDTVYQKAEIKKVSLPHRGRSALVGLLVGAGVGAGIGAGVGVSQGTSNSNTSFVKTSWVAGVGAVLFGLIGALIGSLTDFMGSTIYKG